MSTTLIEIRYPQELESNKLFLQGLASTLASKTAVAFSVRDLVDLQISKSEVTVLLTPWGEYDIHATDIFVSIAVPKNDARAFELISRTDEIVEQLLDACAGTKDMNLSCAVRVQLQQCTTRTCTLGPEKILE